VTKGDTKITEIMPDDVSDEIAAAIAEGRLCRHAVELESQLTAERESKVAARGEVDRLRKQLGTQVGMVEKLTKAIEDYVNNDIGRQDTLRNLEQALADTEIK